MLEDNLVREYQESALESLKSIFGEDCVKKEWDAAKGSEDDFTRELYCPRLDLAVGPFNIHRNIYEDNLNINRMLSVNRNLIRRLWRVSELRTPTFERLMGGKNNNPRCMLAIEIENSGSSKHMLGNIANVSILGAIGIVVPFNAKKLALCKRIKKYVAFSTEVKKIEDVFKNVLIIRKEKFLEVLDDYGMSNTL